MRALAIAPEPPERVLSFQINKVLYIFMAFSESVKNSVSFFEPKLSFLFEYVNFPSCSAACPLTSQSERDAATITLQKMLLGFVLTGGSP